MQANLHPVGSRVDNRAVERGSIREQAALPHSRPSRPPRSNKRQPCCHEQAGA